MATMSYEEILEHSQQLDSLQQLKLMEELAGIVRTRLAHVPRHSILELRGLGKTAWQGIDAQLYVEEERASWLG